MGLLRKLKAERSELGIASNKSLTLVMAYVRGFTVNTDIAEFATMTFTAAFCFSSRCEKSYLYIQLPIPVGSSKKCIPLIVSRVFWKEM